MEGGVATCYGICQCEYPSNTSDVKKKERRNIMF